MLLLNNFFAGLRLGLSLIIAIGAQNVFVLQQGLRQSHVFAVCLTCALSDAILITIGVGGYQIISSKAGWIEPVLTLGGAIFLFAYGAISAKRAIWPKEGMKVGHVEDQPLSAALVTCLALTFLNPHVYLDTVILLGSISTRYEETLRPLFAAGAVIASFVWFFSLGYGARLLQPLFAKPVAWRILDIAIGCVMLMIAWSLLKTH